VSYTHLGNGPATQAVFYTHPGNGPATQAVSYTHLGNGPATQAVFYTHPGNGPATQAVSYTHLGNGPATQAVFYTHLPKWWLSHKPRQFHLAASYCSLPLYKMMLEGRKLKWDEIVSCWEYMEVDKKRK
jgi:hypothetical protein